MRFDGHRLTSFNNLDGLAHDSVGSILERERRDVWMDAQSGGVYGFDGL